MGIASYLITNVVGVVATVHTAEISSSATLPRLDEIISLFHASPVNVSFLIAVISCMGIYYLINKTRWGYEIRAIGLNSSAAEYPANINPKKYYSDIHGSRCVCRSLLEPILSSVISIILN